MPKITPMRLLRIPQPFDHEDFIFEPKMDGFRALAHIEGHRCTLVSRNGNTFKSWPQVAEEIAHSVRCDSAILDGEIVCLDGDGRPNFRSLLFRREWPFFCAFDVLQVEGEKLCQLPLLARKRRLQRVLPKIQGRLRGVEHVVGRGTDLFRASCEMDVEGVVGKWAQGTYATEGRTTSWLKIKNLDYSQMRDRHELFDRTSNSRSGLRATKTLSLELV